MNLILTKHRSRMSPETLDMLLRIRYHPEDLETLDVDYIAFKYLLKFRSCDHGFDVRGDDEEEDDDEIEEEEDSEMDIESVDNNSEGDEEEEQEETVDHMQDHTYGLSPAMENENPRGFFHDYVPNQGRRIRLDLETGTQVFELINLYYGYALTATEDNQVVIKSGVIGHQNRAWFKFENHIVNSKGMVLQSNGIGSPVTMEYVIDDEPKQKWTVRRVDRYNNFEIVNDFDGGALDLMEPRDFEFVVGTKSTRRPYYHDDTYLWKLNNMDENEDWFSERWSAE